MRLKKLSNKLHPGGELRAELPTLKRCKDACLQSVERCEALDFQNGVCRLHYKIDYDYGKITVLYGNDHYHLVSATGQFCPRE